MSPARRWSLMVLGFWRMLECRREEIAFNDFMFNFKTFIERSVANVIYSHLPRLRASLVHHQAVHVFFRSCCASDECFCAFPRVFETRVGVQVCGAVAWVRGADDEAFAFELLGVLHHDHVQRGFRGAVGDPHLCFPSASAMTYGNRPVDGEEWRDSRLALCCLLWRRASSPWMTM